MLRLGRAVLLVPALTMGQVDAVFSALADPTGAACSKRSRGATVTASGLARSCRSRARRSPSTSPRCGGELVSSERVGRETVYSLRPEPLMTPQPGSSRSAPTGTAAWRPCAARSASPALSSGAAPPSRPAARPAAGPPGPGAIELRASSLTCRGTWTSRRSSSTAVSKAAATSSGRDRVVGVAPVGQLLGLGVELGRHLAREDRAQADAGAGELVAKRLGERLVRGLRRPVDGGPGEGAQSGSGADDDDVAAAAVQHRAEPGAHRVDRPGDVGADHQVGVLGILLEERRVPRDAGVGDQQVQSPGPLDEGGGRGLDLLAVGDVGGDRDRPVAQLGRQRLEALGAARDEAHRRAPATSAVAVARPMPRLAPVTSALVCEPDLHDGHPRTAVI